MANLESGVNSPTAADFLAANRGGGLFSEVVNQRVGSYLALAASRIKSAPTTLTLANLVLALGGSLTVILFADRVAMGAPAIALAALVLWQLAYSFDCADGQLARVTGQASPAGARADLLCDVAVQVSFVAAVSSVAAAQHELPAWFVAVFAGSWMVNLLTSVLAAGTGVAGLIQSRSAIVRVIKLIRDYGAIVMAIGLVLIFKPSWTPLAMIFFSISNGVFLLLSIIQAVAAAFSAGGKPAVPHAGR